MKTNFNITGIKNTYHSLFQLTQNELIEKGIVKMVVDKKPGYPCRVSLEDAEIGEEVLLLPYTHHKTKSPYQASGPVFVRNSAIETIMDTNTIPKMLLHRLLSLRVYDKHGMMIQAETIKGNRLRKTIQEIFNNNKSQYIHVHNSGPGCYNSQINRAN